MPKKPSDYSKGLIYSVVCKTDETLLYIGSTTNFRQRKNAHKGACINENNGNHNLQLYVMIRATGGWDSFKMTPVKEYPCESKIQLVIEEERIRKEMKANLNAIRAYVSPEERKEDTKEWFKDNAEHIADYQKQYRETHLLHINEIRKIYKIKNAEHIAEQGKIYSKKNAERIAEYKTQWWQENKQQIQERRKKRYQERKNAL